VDLNAYLVVGALLFTLGVAGVLLRRNVLVMLMSVELMLNGANLTLAAFSRFLNDQAGNALVVFSLTIAAAEVAVGLAILVALSRVFPVVNIDQLDDLRG
jgi:NADH-quinone oxidoreductase subunit K